MIDFDDWLHQVRPIIVDELYPIICPCLLSKRDIMPTHAFDKVAAILIIIYNLAFIVFGVYVVINSEPPTFFTSGVFSIISGTLGILFGTFLFFLIANKISLDKDIVVWPVVTSWSILITFVLLGLSITDNFKVVILLTLILTVMAGFILTRFLLEFKKVGEMQ